jgi:hypothetical protein
MSVKLSYDPMSALGIRLGMPGGVEFLEDEANNIAAIHGVGFLDDLRDAVYRNDWEAAQRVTEALCPEASFAIGSDGQYTLVKITQGEVSQDTKTRDTNRCTALISAATGVRLYAIQKAKGYFTGSEGGEPEEEQDHLPAPR